MKKKSGKKSVKRSRTLWPSDGEEFIGNLGDTMIMGDKIRLKEKGPHPMKIPYAEVNMEPMTITEFKKRELKSWKISEEMKKKEA